MLFEHSLRQGRNILVDVVNEFRPGQGLLRAGGIHELIEIVQQTTVDGWLYRTPVFKFVTRQASNLAFALILIVADLDTKEQVRAAHIGARPWRYDTHAPLGDLHVRRGGSDRCAAAD